MLTAEERGAAATALRVAESRRRAIEPLVDTFPGMDVTDSYEIQLINIGLRVDAGAGIVGHKVGLSSKAMQQMMGVDEPDYGHLLSDMALQERHGGRRLSLAAAAGRTRGRLHPRRGSAGRGLHRG